METWYMSMYLLAAYFHVHGPADVVTITTGVVKVSIFPKIVFQNASSLFIGSLEVWPWSHAQCPP